MEIEHPMKDGLIENWDLMEKLWDHALKDRLRIQPEEHPMLLAEPSFMSLCTVNDRWSNKAAEASTPVTAKPRAMTMLQLAAVLPGDR